MVGIFSVNSERPVNSLQKNFNELLQLQNKLSTGKKINKASDGPAALVISERFQAEISAFRQGIENLQRSENVVATAEASLNETNSLLRKAKELTLASTGAFSSEEREANQQALDEVLNSIDRIANTTSFGKINLLDGTQEPRVSNVSEGIEDVRVDQVGNTKNLSRMVDIEVTAQATRAELQGTIAGQSTDAEIQITGVKGSVVLNLAAGTSVSGVEDAINASTQFTGVEAVAGKIRSRELGNNQSITLRQLSGQLDGVAESYALGTAIEGSINGVTAAGLETELSVNTSDLQATIRFSDTAATGKYSFDLDSSGFEVNLTNDGQQRGIGIQRMASDSLGQSSGLGSLASLRSGGANDLEANTANALEIIDAAIDETSMARGRLGAFQTNTLQSLQRSNEESVIQLEASRSQIADTDYAKALSEFSSQQIQQQAAAAVQAQVQGINRSVLMGLLVF